MISSILAASSKIFDQPKAQSVPSTVETYPFDLLHKKAGKSRGSRSNLRAAPLDNLCDVDARDSALKIQSEQELLLYWLGTSSEATLTAAILGGAKDFCYYVPISFVHNVHSTFPIATPVLKPLCRNHSLPCQR